MGITQPPLPCKLIVALLGASDTLVDAAAGALEERFGPIDARTALVPWTVSAYYAGEMGDELQRQFASFARLVPADELVALKHVTNTLEAAWRRPAGRQVNIDPGYLTATKLVLATTKDAGHRIYLGSGIYAEVTLAFEHGSFRAGPHTYPDYAEPDTLRFFNQVRGRYLRQLRERAGTR